MNVNVCMDDVVMKTPGYVGADINALIDEAIISSLDRKIFDEMCNQNGEKPNCKLVIFEFKPLLRSFYLLSN